MNFIDLIAMLGNLSQSLKSVEHLLGGVSYVVGIALVFISLMKFKQIASAGAQGQEHGSVAMAYMIGGIVLLYLPTALNVVTRTAFGQESVLQYTQPNRWNLFDSIFIMLQAAGVFWFIRGCIIMVHSSKPGHQAGAKGFFYVCAGVLAMNFSMTIGAIGYIIDALVQLVSSFQGH